MKILRTISKKKENLYILKYQFHDQIKNDLINLIINNISEETSYNTNAKCLMTNWIINKSSNKSLNLLIKYIENFINENNIPNKGNIYYEACHVWGLVYKKNDYTEMHNHLPSSFSFIYALEVNSKHPPIEFDSVKVKLEEGELIIFPSFLEHKVGKNKSNCDRMVISGNLFHILYDKK